MIVTFKEDKHLRERERFSSCQNTPPNGPTGVAAQSHRIASVLLMLCAFACVYGLKPTTEYFHTAAALTSSL